MTGLRDAVIHSGRLDESCTCVGDDGACEKHESKLVSFVHALWSRIGRSEQRVPTAPFRSHRHWVWIGLST